MKGSAVAQSLKSLAAALHPQLPLSSKESSRLLTALTGSFRKHLDEVHPPIAAEGNKPKSGNSEALNSSKHAIHSSAALADSHLASVLTNPLLAKDIEAPTQAAQNYMDARLELRTNPAKDPILVLEEYHQKGAATVPIARLCLEAFKQSLIGLDPSAQQHAIEECGAGRRVLLWLWQSEQYKHSKFVDEKAFLDLLVPFLLKEGHEEYIWQWIGLDQVLENDSDPSASGKKQNISHGYRWKGRLVHAMVSERLSSPNREFQKADAALDVYSRANELKISAPAKSHMSYLPLRPAANLLRRALTDKSLEYTHTDVDRYNRFIKDIKRARSSSASAWAEHTVALLWLNHPVSPTPELALEWFQDLYHSGSTRGHQAPADLNKRLDSVQEHSLYIQMTRTAALLQLSDRTDDADWMIPRIRDRWPSLAKHLQDDLGRERRRYQDRQPRRPAQAQHSEHNTSERVPFPTFA